MRNQNLSLETGFVQIELFTLPVCVTVILHSMNNHVCISLYRYIIIYIYVFQIINMSANKTNQIPTLLRHYLFLLQAAQAHP